MDSIIEVTIVNWEKYQLRKDIKRPWWFALSNTFFTDPDFFEFSDQEKLVWIYILSEASKLQRPRVKINVIFADKVCGLKQKSVLSAVSKLKHLGCLEHVQNPYGSRTQSVLHITEQNKTEQNKYTLAQSFDFASVYEIFPRKVGKQKGLGILRRSVKTPEDFVLLTHAVKKYRDHVAQEQTEARYIKHFSTWATSWRDWCDENVGTSTVTAGGMPDLSHIEWDEK